MYGSSQLGPPVVLLCHSPVWEKMAWQTLGSPNAGSILCMVGVLSWSHSWLSSMANCKKKNLKIKAERGVLFLLIWVRFRCEQSKQSRAGAGALLLGDARKPRPLYLSPPHHYPQPTPSPCGLKLAAQTFLDDMWHSRQEEGGTGRAYPLSTPFENSTLLHPAVLWLSPIKLTLDLNCYGGDRRCAIWPQGVLSHKWIDALVLRAGVSIPTLLLRQPLQCACIL